MATPNMTIRAFVAASIPDSTRNLAAEISEPLLDNIRGLKMVKPSHFHLTLAFIGDIDQNLLESSFESLSVMASGAKPFHVSFDRIGTFPGVIFLKTSDGSQEMVDLASAVRTILRKSEIPYDKKPFKGHLTIARTRDRRSTPQEFLKIYACDARFDIGFTLSRFEVIQSELTREGPIYTTLRSFTLQSGEV